MVNHTEKNLDAALAAAVAGLHVFPARVHLNHRSAKWDKIPIIPGWQQRASTDEEQLRAWWREFPHALPGIGLGRDGLIAIDPDRHGGPDGVAAWAALVAEHGGLPEHPITITPSGGEHHLFRQPPDVLLGNGEGALPAGINVRGRGGFIFAQDAVREDGKAWRCAPNVVSLADAFRCDAVPVVPDWLLQILRRHRDRPEAAAKTPPPTISIDRAPTGREMAYGTSAVSAIVSKLAATERDRNIALNSAAFRFGQLAARGWINSASAIAGLHRACEENGLAREEPHKICKTIESGWAAGLQHPHPDLVDRPYRRSKARNGL